MNVARSFLLELKRISFHSWNNSQHLFHFTSLLSQADYMYMWNLYSVMFYVDSLRGVKKVRDFMFLEGMPA